MRASRSSIDSPDPSESFTRTPTPAGNSFSETVRSTYEEEGTASFEIICTSTKDIQNTAKASTALVQFGTQMKLELRNNATGQLQEGFIYAGDDSIYTDTGIIDIVLSDQDVRSIRAGLIDEDGGLGSYLREISITPGQENRPEMYMVDFKFRDPSTG